MIKILYIHHCMIFLNEFFILINCSSNYKNWKRVFSWFLILFKSALHMHLIQNFIDNSLFIDWENIKSVFEFDFNKFSIIFKLDLHSKFFKYIHHSFSIRSYIQISVYNFFQLVRFSVLMNFNIKWDWNIFFRICYWMWTFRIAWQILKQLNHENSH